MKIGFSILSHKQPDFVFTSLLDELQKYPNKTISIHHDFEQTPLSKDCFMRENVLLTSSSYRTYWSHTNNIYAIWETFKQLYSENCDWYITLSANCFPIKQWSYISSFLSESNFDGYIECNNIFTDYFDFYQYFRKGFNTKYILKIPFISRKGKFYWRAIRCKREQNKIPFNQSFIPYHGSDWFMLNKKAMAYLMSEEKKIFEINNFLKEVNKGPDVNVCPPEVVFQTILKNNPRLTLNNENFRYINWEGSKEWHPNTLDLYHWDNIKASSALFARKFDEKRSSELIDKIKKDILL